MTARGGMFQVKSWCPECEKATPSKGCEWCGGQVLTCAICGTHPDCCNPGDEVDDE